MGLIPNTPVNRRVQRETASAVDIISIVKERRLHVERRHLFQLATSRYQPLLSMISVIARKGHVSACNAGAVASPVGAPPRRPSKPGTTHHQGNGSRPLNRATKGFSTWMIFCIWSAPEVRPNFGTYALPGQTGVREVFGCQATKATCERCILLGPRHGSSDRIAIYRPRFYVIPTPALPLKGGEGSQAWI